VPVREPPLTVKEAATALNQSEKAIRALCQAGELRGAYKNGGQGITSHWRIPVKAIDTYEMLRARS
jgi:excisionase family DNA binding protein